MAYCTIAVEEHPHPHQIRQSLKSCETRSTYNAAAELKQALLDSCAKSPAVCSALRSAPKEGFGSSLEAGARVPNIPGAGFRASVRA